MRSFVAIACLVATTALAQKTEPAPKPARAQQVTFDGNDLIEGALQHPSGEIISVPPRGKWGSLIQVRMNFNDKLRESVHEM